MLRLVLLDEIMIMMKYRRLSSLIGIIDSTVHDWLSSPSTYADELY
jgi:hypothetical protein